MPSHLIIKKNQKELLEQSYVNVQPESNSSFPSHQHHPKSSFFPSPSVSPGILAKDSFSVVKSAAITSIGFLESHVSSECIASPSPPSVSNDEDSGSLMDVCYGSLDKAISSMDIDSSLPPLAGEDLSERSKSISSSIQSDPDLLSGTAFVQNPLDLPDILHIVFKFLGNTLNTGTDPSKPLDFVKIDSIKYAISKPRIHSCLLVNKLWNACATKVLWKHVKIGHELGCKRFSFSLESQLRLSDNSSIIRNTCSSVNPSLCIHHKVSSNFHEVKFKGTSYIKSCVNRWQYGLLIKSFTIIPPHGPSTENFTDWNIDQIVTTLALSCPNLEELHLSNCTQVSDKSMVLLARHCPNLKVINLNRCDLISDVTLLELSKYCRKLEIVNFSRPLMYPRLFLSDHAMYSIVKDQPNLAEIRFRNCDSVTDRTVIELARTSNSNLKALDLRKVLSLISLFSWCNKITDACIISGLAIYCPNLISLALNGCKRLTDSSLNALLGSCSSIASLSLAHLPFITDDVISRFACKLKHLVILSLNGCNSIRDPSIIALAKACPNLQSLSLFSLMISDRSVEVIAKNCRNLTSLSISGCRSVTDVGAEAITSLAGLQSLYLNGAKITDASVLKIARSCPLIRALSLNECRDLTDRSIISLSRYTPRLQSLSMNGCGATVASLKELVENCADLRELSVKGCPKCNLRGPLAQEIQVGNGGMSQYSAVGEQVLARLMKKRIALILD